MYHGDWNRASTGIYLGSAVAVILATLLLLLLRFLPPPQLLAMALLAYGGIAVVARRLQVERGARVEKRFGVDKEVAAKVVANVLREKGLPFRCRREQEMLCFDAGGELTLYVVGEGAEKGVMVSRIVILPVTHETALLVASLQLKLDEGFTPRGAGSRGAS
jgi:hypothetical protein